MSNSILFRSKVSEDRPNLKQTITLPTVVTTCLAPCTECRGEYIDFTSSFRIICQCTCGHNLDSQNNNIRGKGRIGSTGDIHQADNLTGNGLGKEVAIDIVD